MNLLITRTSWCKHCERSGNPGVGNLYATFGTTSQLYCPHVVTNEVPYSKKGFTPHLFEKVGVEQLASGLYVRVEKTCMIDGCGILITTYPIKGGELMCKGINGKDGNGKDTYYYIYRMKVSKGLLPIKDWNALVKDWRSTGYELK